MKKGDLIIGSVEGITFPNQGYFHTEEGDLVIVKNAIPGQTVESRIVKKRSGHYEGVLRRVLKEVPDLDPQSCGQAGICGGCLYQQLPYEESLYWKERQMKELLLPALTTAERTELEEGYLFEGIFPSPVTEGYRNKMEYSFGDEVKDGPLVLGLHKRNSNYDLVCVEDCRIISPAQRAVLKAVGAFFRERELPYYRKMQHTGYLRHLLVRQSKAEQKLMVALVTTSAYPEVSEPEEEMLRQFRDRLLSLEQEGAAAFGGILHMVNDSAADVVRSDRTELLYGTEFLREELLGLSFRISPFSFFQTNTAGAEILYSRVRDYVMLSGEREAALAERSGEEKTGAMRTVFDLYSGTGTIAQILAPCVGADRVIGVEIVEEAVEAARVNAALNGLQEKCTFIAGDVLKVLDELTERPDLIVLDPPRDGIHPKALPKILSYGVKHIVYISCKPTSFVRDLAMFHQCGYRIVKSSAVDQFPFTANTELIALLEREGGKENG